MREKQGRIGTLRERESTRLFKSLRNLSPVFLADGFPSPPEDTETHGGQTDGRTRRWTQPDSRQKNKDEKKEGKKRKDKEKEDTQSDASEEFLWDQQLHGEKKTEGVEKISRARAREVLEERMVEVDELTVTGIGDFAFFLLKHFKYVMKGLAQGEFHDLLDSPEKRKQAGMPGTAVTGPVDTWPDEQTECPISLLDKVTTETEAVPVDVYAAVLEQAEV